jgi:putative endonuclease
MEYWVYIPKCSDGSYYTGSTSNLENRVRQHMLGSANSYTKSRLPVNWYMQNLAILLDKQCHGKNKLKVGRGQRKKRSSEGILRRWWNYPNPKVNAALSQSKCGSNL